MTREEAGEIALQALEKLVQAASLNDLVYDVREREGQGWSGSRVQLWSNGCALASRALIAANVKVPAPYQRPAFGIEESYYIFAENPGGVEAE